MGLLIHHLRKSQSERIVWLCHELSIPHDTKLYDRVSLAAPAEYKALHPLGTAPIIQDGPVTLAESGACIEYIAHKHGQGRLFLKPDDAAYADFLFWWHWGNASLLPALARAHSARLSGLDAAHPSRTIAETRESNSLRILEDRLRENTWLAGEEFTAADLMAVFSLTTLRYFIRYSLGEYPSILEYLERINGRKAYRDAMRESDPGMQLVLGPEPPASDEEK
ncbi:glutathione S-transferase [Podospora appendiculata]|uniref:Glutathione S-transferase n=1 Tax=Podospora appendiculata TaxID=314037 RepID=A0AAE0X1T5_9PEZI|nr:glutathione S-transferase [Podospora appendiculata]